MNSKKIMPIMAHLVLGYPTLAESLVTAEQYIAAGCEILELQIPFSHPTADGPVITQACRDAVEKNHVTVEDCFEAISTLRNLYPNQEIIVMTYLNRLFTFGLEAFTVALHDLQITHLIVPDLPVDSPLASQISQKNIQLIPVLAANIAPQRLEMLLHLGFDFYYLMSDFKITGSGFSLHPRINEVIAVIREKQPTSRIGIGFGISTPEQVSLVTATADVAIIGSSLIKAQSEGRLEKYLEELVS
jgi:tryptophan synthase alpha chain